MKTKWSSEQQSRAACSTEDPELFYPVDLSEPTLEQIATAQAVCYRCPIAGACMEWALATGENHGVWGGLDEYERRSIRRRRVRVARQARQAAGVTL